MFNEALKSVDGEREYWMLHDWFELDGEWY
jgi:hypothetical protein